MIPSADDTVINTALTGNLCRCTGYQQMRIGIISMLVGISSLSVAILNFRQARRAQRDKAAAGEASPALDTKPGTATAPATGSHIKVRSVRAQNVAFGNGNTNNFGPVGNSGTQKRGQG